MATTKLVGGARPIGLAATTYKADGARPFSCATPPQVNLSLNSPRSGQGVLGLDKIGLDTQGLLVVPDCFLHLAQSD